METEGFYSRFREALQGQRERYQETLGALDAAARAAIQAEEQRVLEHLEHVLDEPNRRRAEAFDAQMEAVQASLPAPPAGSAPARSLEDLGVESLHALAQMDSGLRHSIVEACLMNLRGYAEALDARRTDGTFLEKLGRQVGLLPGVVKQVVDFFSKPLAAGVAIKDLLPSAYRVCLAAVRGTLWVVDRFRGAQADAAPLGGRELATKVDALTEALTEVRKALDARRVALADAARDGVEALQGLAEREGVELSFEDRTDGAARLFLDRPAVANAVGEAVRNAIRHGLAGVAAPRRVAVCVQEDDPPSTHARVIVQDNGRGFDPAVLEKAGREAVSTSGGGAGLGLVFEAARRHFGRVELASPQGGGAQVAIVFPRHAPRPESPSR